MLEKNYYIVIPGVVRTDKRLSSDEQLLYGEITSLSNLHGYCWATNEYLGNLMQASERTIQRYLKNLIACGHITITFDDTGNGSTRKIFLMAATPTTQGDTQQKTHPPVNPRKKGGVKPVDKNILSKEYSKVEYSNTVNSDELTGAGPSDVPVEEPTPPQPEPPKTEKVKTVTQLFIDIYDQWFKKRNDGVPPKYDGAAGNATKALIWYFRSIVKSKAVAAGKGKLSDAEEDKQLLNSWAYVLENWHKLDNFLQEKTRLVDINANIQNIINRMKNVNATSKKTNGTGNRVTDDGLKAELSKRFGAGEQTTD